MSYLTTGLHVGVHPGDGGYAVTAEARRWRLVVERVVDPWFARDLAEVLLILFFLLARRVLGYRL